MLSLEEAQARLLHGVSPLASETIRAEAANGRFLAQPLIARRSQPAADLSAMDGYGVRGDDLPGPWTVVGESAAGHPFAGVLNPGEAVRISTGALMPDGTGAVLLQEECLRDRDMIRFIGTPPHPLDKHVRRKGFDFAEGDAVLAAGEAITPARAALALMAGHAELPVGRRPTLAIIDSGDELAAPGQSLPLHQIPASNGPMLNAMCAGLVAQSIRIGPVADRIEDLLAAFAAAGEADVIVTSGGASVGDHDLIRPALEAWGATIDFWRVAIKPGKPLLVAHKGRQLVLGLPGNPVSGYVTAFLFLLPLLRRLAGDADPMPHRCTQALARPMPAGGARREFVRGVIASDGVYPIEQSDSSALVALAAANCLIEREVEAPPSPAGQLVKVFPLHFG